MCQFNFLLNSINIEKVKKDLKNEGCSILGLALNEESLSKLRSQIDKCSLAEDVEVNYNGSEHRIWRAYEKHPLIADFKKFSDEVMSKIKGTSQEAYDVLACRNFEISKENNDIIGGRWHLDSFRSQKKIFMFLSDVSKHSGPFEMVCGTQRFSFKFSELLKGNLITMSDVINGTRRYRSLSEQVVKKIIDSGNYKSKVFDVPKGTVAIVDTSCVHRAHPCFEGNRYSLTTYYS